MSDRAERRIAGCSHGMRQRIKLAQALVHDPPVLLLDEPLNGIDPGGRREIHELLARQAEQGKTILVSSHILNEVEQLTDSILMIGRGRIVASGTLQEIRMLLDDQPFTVQIVAAEARRLAGMLLERADIRSVEVRDETLVVRTRNPAHFFALLADLVQAHQFAIERFETIDADASAVFDYLQGTRS
jgi:ABC-2 type transport system ATP-binding protein